MSTRVEQSARARCGRRGPRPLNPRLRLGASVVCLTVLLSACSVPASNRGTHSVATPPVEEQSPTAADATAIRSFREALTSPELSATVTLEGTHRSWARFERTLTGTGVIAGRDSSISIEEHFTDQTGPVMFPGGQVFGPGHATSRLQEWRELDGALFTRTDGGRWIRQRGTGYGTPLGHMLDLIGKVDSWRRTGSEVIGGQQLVVFSSQSFVPVDPAFLDVGGPTQTEPLGGTVEVLIDAATNPQTVRLSVANLHPGIGAAGLEVAFHLDALGEEHVVAEPGTPWVWTSTLDLKSAGVDLLVPADWVVSEDTAQYFTLDAPDGRRLTIEGARFEVADPWAAMEQWVAAWDAGSTVVTRLPAPDDSAFPTALAIIEFPSRDRGTAATSVAFFGVLAVMLRPDDSGSGAGLVEMLETLRLGDAAWPRVVPGETLADARSQDAVREDVLTAASEDGCADPVVVHTALATGSENAWTEDWYVQTCGLLQRTTIEFDLTAGYRIHTPLMPAGDE